MKGMVVCVIKIDIRRVHGNKRRSPRGNHRVFRNENEVGGKRLFFPRDKGEEGVRVRVCELKIDEAKRRKE